MINQLAHIICGMQNSKKRKCRKEKDMLAKRVVWHDFQLIVQGKYNKNGRHNFDKIQQIASHHIMIGGETWIS